MKIATWGYHILLILILCCSETENDKAQQIEIPNLQKGCLSGQCVDGQFQTSYQRFTLISGDGINLRSRSDLHSRVIVQLPSTRKVTVLHLKPDQVTINGKSGRWAYIRDTSNINIEGWVFDHYLATPSHFEKASPWKIREIRVILGDTLSIYRCTPGGRFKGTPVGKNSSPGNRATDEEIQGDVLEYRNIIWLKNDDKDDHPLFFRKLKNGRLELPDQYKTIRGTVLTK